MPFPDGTSLDQMLDRLAPEAIRSVLRPLTTEGVSEEPFAGGVLYRGTLKSVQTDPLDLGFGKLHLPGVTSGIIFRLALFDDPRGRWHLDLLPERLPLVLDDLHCADLIPEQGTMPRRLVRRLTDTGVVITGEAVLRLARASALDGVAVLFVDHASSVDPLARTGPVVSLRCTPPHFFLGGSQFALSVSELVFDASPDVTPAFVTAQGQGPEWMGLALAEATFFAPPNAMGQGGFSAGLRNLLLGAPRGIQGELEVQWGRSPLAPSTFVFVQDGQGPTGATTDRVVALTGGQDRPVGMAVAIQAASPPEGSWSVIWRWPDGTTSEGANGSGQVRHGQILRAVPQEVLPSGRRLTHPEISFRFVSQGDAPQIAVTAAGTRLERALQVSGPDQALAGLVLHGVSTAPQPGAFTWHLSDDGPAIPGANLTLSAAMIADAAPTGHVILRETDAQGRVRQARLRLDRVQGKPLLIGTESGVIDAAAPAAPLALQGVEDSFDLTDFHASGAMRQSGAQARADAARPSGVDVPAGVLAQVTLAEPLPPLPVEHDRHVQVLFQFANGIPAGWGEMRPARAEPTASPQGAGHAGQGMGCELPGRDLPCDRALRRSGQRRAEQDPRPVAGRNRSGHPEQPARSQRAGGDRGQPDHPLGRTGGPRRWRPHPAAGPGRTRRRPADRNPRGSHRLARPAQHRPRLREAARKLSPGGSLCHRRHAPACRHPASRHSRHSRRTRALAATDAGARSGGGARACAGLDARDGQAAEAGRGLGQALGRGLARPDPVQGPVRIRLDPGLGRSARPWRGSPSIWAARSSRSTAAGRMTTRPTSPAARSAFAPTTIPTR